MLQSNDRFLIGVDVDGVVADLVGGLLDIIHQRSGQRILPEQITGFEFQKSMDEQLWLLAQEILIEPGFAKSLKPYPHAVDGITQLRNLGRVVFVTSPFVKNPTWAYERGCWLRHHTDADWKDIVHIDDKSVFGGDVLIDDAPHQLKAWVNTGRPAIRVVRPWNNNADGIAANSWDEIVARTREVLVRTA